MARVQFPDGTCVEALAIGEREPNKPTRDYGLYFDAAWQPTWPAAVIDWEDFGLPVNQEAAAAQIRQAFERAKGGDRVEIGCIGGLGRTGTALACMAILAGVPPAQAVQWVKDHYHPGAVETDAQNEWVLWFGEHTRNRATQ
jgi:hypothetical protein